MLIILSTKWTSADFTTTTDDCVHQEWPRGVGAGTPIGTRKKKDDFITPYNEDGLLHLKWYSALKNERLLNRVQAVSPWTTLQSFAIISCSPWTTLQSFAIISCSPWTTLQSFAIISCSPSPPSSRLLSLVAHPPHPPVVCYHYLLTLGRGFSLSEGARRSPVPRRPWIRPQLSESENPLEPRLVLASTRGRFPAATTQRD